MSSYYIDQIKTVFFTVEDAFLAAGEGLKAYIAAHGGVEGALSHINSKLSYAVTTLSSLAAIVGIPAGYITLIDKVFAGLQGLTSMILQIHTVLNQPQTAGV